MTGLLIVFALLAALVGGTVALFTVGTVGAVVVVAGIIALTAAALYVRGLLVKAALAATVLIALGSFGFGGYSALQLTSALRSYDGAVDAPDPEALASGEAKLDRARSEAGFRVELTEEELTAILQDTLADASSNPIRRVDLTVEDGRDGGQGSLKFDLTFKSGALTGRGRVTAGIEAGAIRIDVQEVSLGRLSLPGLASGAMEDLIETVLDLNKRLAEVGADVQALEIGDGRVLVSGTQGDGSVLTARSLLDALAENAAAVGEAPAPPVGDVAPGIVDGPTQDGSTYVVALGDSLAAGVGVPAAREGYVSRIHRVASERAGSALGLRNFAVSGETSGTMIRGGQLEAALDFIRNHDITLVTIDIGANDLLGHLGSEDCADDVETPACRARLGPALAAYRANLDRILRDVRAAAGDDTPVYLLLTYNPFSLGIGSLRIAAASDEATQELNAVASAVAAAHRVTVADGFTPMQGTTATTTHMLAAQPDIHPNALGHTVLAQALVDVMR